MSSPEVNVLLQRVSRQLIETDWAADSRWFNQGLAILAADDEIGRSVMVNEIDRGMHMNGTITMFPSGRIPRLRYIAKAFQAMGFRRAREVYGCKVADAYSLSVHYNHGRTTPEEVRRIISAMRTHYKSDLVNFQSLSTLDGLQEVREFLAAR